MAFKWSDQQNAIFDAVLDDKRKHIIVDARAGTAKTTTAVEAVKRVLSRSNKRILVCAYNTRIRDELQLKLDGTDALVRSTNQVGYAMVRGAFRGVQFHGDKGRDCAATAIDAAEMNLNRLERGLWISKVTQLSSLAKNTLASEKEDLITLALDNEITDETWEEYYDSLPPDQTGNVRHLPRALVSAPDADDPPPPQYPLRKLVPLALEALRMAVEDNANVDFDDQLWFPARYDLQPTRPFDMIVCDELQDFNNSQIWLIRRMLSQHGRLIMFGDPWQALYKFRGADADAMPRMQRELNAEVLPLTTTYRCPKKIVAEARLIVSDYQAAPDAPEGVVEHKVWADMIKQADRGDFILSRKVAPLVVAALSLIEEAKTITIAGMDYVAVIKGMIRKSMARDLYQLVEWVKKTQEKEVRRHRTAGRDREAGEVRDRYRVLEALCSYSRTVSQVEDLASEIFGAATSAAITLSTVHKAKGLERQRVWLLSETFKSDSAEELRIHYVARTRAQKTLIYVTGIPNYEKDEPDVEEQHNDTDRKHRN